MIQLNEGYFGSRVPRNVRRQWAAEAAKELQIMLNDPAQAEAENFVVERPN